MLLLWLAVAGVLVAIVGALNLPVYYALSKSSRCVVGRMTDRDVKNHDAIEVRFEVAGTAYAKSSSFVGAPNPPKQQLKENDEVLVCYLPKDPHTASLGYPPSFLSERLSALVSPRFVVPPLLRRSIFLPSGVVCGCSGGPIRAETCRRGNSPHSFSCATGKVRSV